MVISLRNFPTSLFTSSVLDAGISHSLGQVRSQKMGRIENTNPVS
jgi:hypothetical protein